MRIRLLLAAALAVPALAAPAQAGPVEDWCWENVPSLRLSALVCGKMPDGV
ncbi:MAG TPA: hypothetical protein VNA20_00885 [Frankiaceae bacterium]|nr:hypothetical protein [Frankiaceae bacterium]